MGGPRAEALLRHRRRGIAIVPQVLGLVGELSMAENVEMVDLITEHAVPGGVLYRLELRRNGTRC